MFKLIETEPLSPAERVLKQIEAQSRKQFLPIVGPQKGKVLIEWIHKIKPKRVLEVGTLIGYSAILMAKELAAEAELLTIEIHPEEVKTARENIKKAKIQPTVKCLVGDALEIIPTLSGQFDLVFLDAEKTEYLRYLQLAEDKIHVGTVIVADNAGVFAEQMRDYLNYVRSSSKYNSRFHSYGSDGMEVTERIK